MYGGGAAVALVRQATELTQAELATRASLSQGYISKIENGSLDLVDPYLSQVADALGCPAELLAAGGLDGSSVSCIHHRRRRSRLTVTTTRRIEALAELTSLSVTRLTTHANMPAHSLDGIEKGEASPAEAARSARRALGLSEGPVKSVAGAVESLGVVIIRRPLGPSTVEDAALGAQDGVSAQHARRRPVVVVSSSLPSDRERFTLAHELGHLLLHGHIATLGDDDVEAEANSFAAEFLMPETEIAPLLDALTERQFRRLLDLKSEWRVSVAALIERAKQTNAVNSATHRRLRIRLNEYGWQRGEPASFERDETSLLHETVDRLRTQGAGLADIARIAYMRVKPFTSIYMTEINMPAGARETGEDQM